jgi:hypothetical protein
MLEKLTLAIVMCGLAVHGFSQATPIVTIKHLELLQYPDLARLARLQGSVSIHLRIAAGGKVMSAEASTADGLLKEHPLLQTETLKLIREWTFSCVNCVPGAEYEHVLTFAYKLEGPQAKFNNSHFTMDLPDRVTIATNPPEVSGY